MSVIHLLVAYGLCFGLMQDKALFTIPLKKLPLVGRLFVAQLACAFCTGFHCGWAVYLLESARSGFGSLWYIDLTMYALASAAFCLLADVSLGAIDGLIPTPEQGT